MSKCINQSTSIFSLIIILLAGLMIMPGCKDEDPEIYDFSAVSEDFMQTYVTCIHLFFYVDGMAKSVEDSLSVHPEGSYLLNGGTVTVDPAVPGEYPKTFLVDFGTTGKDDIIAGKITGAINESYISEGSTVVYEYEDLTIHNDRPAGSNQITNMGLSSGNILFNFQVSESTFIRNFEADSAYPVTFSGFHQVLWSESDNQITMPSGTFTGQSMRADSLKFQAVVDESYKLIKEEDCTYIRDGMFDFTVSLSRDDEKVGEGIVDFGFMNPVDCDQYVIAVIDGEVSRTEFIYLMDWVNFK